MASRGGEFSFFQGTHVKINITIDISISVRPMTTKFDKQVHLQDLTWMGLIKQAWWRHHIKTRNKLETLYLHYYSFYSHQTWQHGNLAWWAPADRVTWSFDHLILYDQMMNQVLY